MRLIGVIGLLAGLVFGLAAMTTGSSAMRFESGSFVIDAADLNSVGGASGSTNYQLESSGGDSVIGNGSGGSYRLAAGYISQIVTPAITVSVQPEGLESYYPLDEGAGTVVHDNSVNTFLGSFIGIPTWQSGKIGKAIEFSGANQAIDFTDSSQGQLTKGTVEMWIKTSQATGTPVLAGKDGAWEIGLTSGKLQLYNFSNNSACTSSANVADNDWHHVAMTLDSGVSNGSTLYVDGQQVASCTWVPSSQSGILTIAAKRSGTAYSDYYAGLIDHLRIFNRQLSGEEIEAEYDAQSQGASSGLTLRTITPGISNSVGLDIVTLTSGSSYNLAVSQDHDLKKGAITIPPISSSQATPASWSEGATKGLGFTLSSSTSTPIDGRWSSGTKYGALTSTAEPVYTRIGTQDLGKDTVTASLRLDVDPDQESGRYQNTMTITGTAAP